MQKLLAALTIATVVALAVPANATPVSVEERNLAYFLNAAGVEAVPDGTGTLYVAGESQTMSVEEAFALAVKRAGNVDLAAISSSAAPTDGFGVGDVWALEFGAGACPPAVILGASPLPPGDYSNYVPQTWVYGNSALGTQTSSGYGEIIDWTTKSTGGIYTAGVTVIGHSDFWCFEFFGIYIFFPFVDGTVTAN